MKQPANLLFSALFCILLGSCDLVSLVPTPAPRVESCEPGGTLLPPPNLGEFRLTFSRAMNPAVTTAAITLRYDGQTADFAAVWKDDHSLTLSPEELPREDSLVTLHLSTQTEAADGASLREDFWHRVTTRGYGTETLSVSLADDQGLFLDSLTSGLALSFSCPVDRESFANALEIWPAIGYATVWDDSGQSLVISPRGTWQADHWYQLRVNETLRSLQGARMLAPVTLVFKTPAEPELSLSHAAVDGRALAVGGFLDRVPPHAEIVLTFGQAVEPGRWSDLVRLVPFEECRQSWSPDGLTCTLEALDGWNWEQEYRISTVEWQGWFLANHPDGSPPRPLQAWFIPEGQTQVYAMDGEAPDLALSPIGDAPGFLLLVEHSPAASMDRLEIMRSVSLSTTNRCCIMNLVGVSLLASAPASALVATIAGLGLSLPRLPALESERSYSLFRLAAETSREGSSPGLILLRVASGLADSAGNLSSQGREFLLHKEAVE